MVNAQFHLALVRFKRFGKQSLRGNVHRHNVLRNVILRGKIGDNIPQIGGGDAGIGRRPGGLAQLFQGSAQAGGAAQSVSVRPDMGENEEIVPFREPPGGLILRHGHALFPPNRSSCG